MNTTNLFYVVFIIIQQLTTNQHHLRKSTCQPLTISALQIYRHHFLPHRTLQRWFNEMSFSRLHNLLPRSAFVVVFDKWTGSRSICIQGPQKKREVSLYEKYVSSNVPIRALHYMCVKQFKWQRRNITRFVLNCQERVLTKKIQIWSTRFERKKE